MNRFGYDEVRGTVIGPVDTRRHYGFFQDGQAIATGNFESDADAIAWFRDKHPARFAEGCEMRVWDK